MWQWCINGSASGIYGSVESRSSLSELITNHVIHALISIEIVLDNKS